MIHPLHRNLQKLQAQVSPRRQLSPPAAQVLPRHLQRQKLQRRKLPKQRKHLPPRSRKYAPKYGIKVYSPIIAQAIHESGWGESSLSAKYHNYFGLKCGTLWTGKSVNLSTKEEYSAGTLTTIRSNFRVYDNMEQGVKGYFEFIQLARYANLKGVTNPRQYLTNIKNDGYATGSLYVDHTMALINLYNLTQFDK